MQYHLGAQVGRFRCFPYYYPLVKTTLEGAKRGLARPIKPKAPLPMKIRQ